jgi:hypothetical protein
MSTKKKTALRPQKIEVLKDDINRAERGQPESCMVARAVIRTLQLEGSGALVSVDGESVAIYGPGNEGKFVDMDLPEVIQDYIEQWDDGDDLDPFDFDLNLPADWREQVGMGLA